MFTYSWSFLLTILAPTVSKNTSPKNGAASLRPLLGSPSPQSCSSEKTLFGTVWKTSRIFREFFCGHFPWKLQDENLQKNSPKFRRVFRRSLTKNSRELRSGGMRAQPLQRGYGAAMQLVSNRLNLHSLWYPFFPCEAVNG